MDQLQISLQGVAEMSELIHEVRETTDKFDSG